MASQNVYAEAAVAALAVLTAPMASGPLKDKATELAMEIVNSGLVTSSPQQLDDAPSVPKGNVFSPVAQSSSPTIPTESTKKDTHRSTPAVVETAPKHMRAVSLVSGLKPPKSFKDRMHDLLEAEYKAFQIYKARVADKEKAALPPRSEPSVVVAMTMLQAQLMQTQTILDSLQQALRNDAPAADIRALMGTAMTIPTTLSGGLATTLSPAVVAAMSPPMKKEYLQLMAEHAHQAQQLEQLHGLWRKATEKNLLEKVAENITNQLTVMPPLFNTTSPPPLLVPTATSVSSTNNNGRAVAGGTDAAFNTTLATAAATLGVSPFLSAPKQLEAPLQPLSYPDIPQGADPELVKRLFNAISPIKEPPQPPLVQPVAGAVPLTINPEFVEYVRALLKSQLQKEQREPLTGDQLRWVDQQVALEVEKIRVKQMNALGAQQQQAAVAAAVTTIQNHQEYTAAAAAWHKQQELNAFYHKHPSMLRPGQEGSTAAGFGHASPNMLQPSPTNSTSARPPNTYLTGTEAGFPPMGHGLSYMGTSDPSAMSSVDGFNNKEYAQQGSVNQTQLGYAFGAQSLPPPQVHANPFPYISPPPWPSPLLTDTHSVPSLPYSPQPGGQIASSEIPPIGVGALYYQQSNNIPLPAASHPTQSQASSPKQYPPASPASPAGNNPNASLPPQPKTSPPPAPSESQPTTSAPPRGRVAHSPVRQSSPPAGNPSSLFSSVSSTAAGAASNLRRNSIPKDSTLAAARKPSPTPVSTQQTASAPAANNSSIISITEDTPLSPPVANTSNPANRPRAAGVSRFAKFVKVPPSDKLNNEDILVVAPAKRGPSASAPSDEGKVLNTNAFNEDQPLKPPPKE